MIFLGEASNYRGKILHHLLATGKESDANALKSYLSKRYKSENSSVALTVNGRSALCLALKSLVPPHSEVVVNAFTCHAVLVAIRGAKCIPVFADIEEKTLNYTPETLEKLLKHSHNIRAIIVQNTLGYPVDIRPFESLTKKYNLKLIEDLAHCASRIYPDGRECGTVGDATCLSFGKGKSIDTITGGTLILHNANKKIIFPSQKPRFADTFRARFYPVFGALLRALYHIHLNKPLAFLLQKLHFIERSADSPLDLTRRLSYWQSKLALESLKSSKPTKEPLRSFYLVNNREELLNSLRKSGYVFDEFWYEVPISPARYYPPAGFNESYYPVAASVSRRIINLPTWYEKDKLKTAKKLIEDHKNANN